MHGQSKTYVNLFEETEEFILIQKQKMFVLYVFPFLIQNSTKTQGRHMH